MSKPGAWHRFLSFTLKGVSVDSNIMKKLALLVTLGLAVGLVVSVPATGKATFRQVSQRALNHLSGAPVTRYYAAHPELAPAQLQSRLRAFQKLAKPGYRSGPSLGPPSNDRMNNDTDGMPQNEESATVCRQNTNLLLEGTNDYRGLLTLEENITGWHWSNAGTHDLTNEGLLPPVVLSDLTTRPSGGDPVDVCRNFSGVNTLYAASLNYDPVDVFGQTSAIGVYKSTEAVLNSCPPGGASCWPTAEAVAESAPDHFLDKEWLDAGDTGDGDHVWVTYTDFDNSQPCCFADIMAVRCLADLSSCTTPMQIDKLTDDDVQFSDVTIGKDNRVYITYAQIIGEIEEEAQTFVVKLRVGDVGCSNISCFGPVRDVYTIDLPMPFGGFLQADDFRIASVPKNAVKILSDDTPRIFVVWDQCKARPLDTICEEPRVQMRYSDNDGVSWSTVKTLSKTSVDRVDYFPTIADDRKNNNVVVAWFTNRLDDYQNAQNIEMVTLDATTTDISKRQIVTTSSDMPNEPEADPFLGGFFIGDYIEVTAHKGTAYIGYNMNVRSVVFLGLGESVRQQDNYLSSATE
jgi:hypothetical protein